MTVLPLSTSVEREEGGGRREEREEGEEEGGERGRRREGRRGGKGVSDVGKEGTSSLTAHLPC